MSSLVVGATPFTGLHTPPSATPLIPPHLIAAGKIDVEGCVKCISTHIKNSSEETVDRVIEEVCQLKTQDDDCTRLVSIRNETVMRLVEKGWWEKALRLVLRVLVENQPPVDEDARKRSAYWKDDLMAAQHSLLYCLQNPQENAQFAFFYPEDPACDSSEAITKTLEDIHSLLVTYLKTLPSYERVIFFDAIQEKICLAHEKRDIWCIPQAFCEIVLNRWSLTEAEITLAAALANTLSSGAARWRLFNELCRNDRFWLTDNDRLRAIKFVSLIRGESERTALLYTFCASFSPLPQGGHSQWQPNYRRWLEAVAKAVPNEPLLWSALSGLAIKTHTGRNLSFEAVMIKEMIPLEHPAIRARTIYWMAYKLAEYGNMSEARIMADELTDDDLKGRLYYFFAKTFATRGLIRSAIRMANRIPPSFDDESFLAGYQITDSDSNRHLRRINKLWRLAKISKLPAHQQI